MGELVLDDKRRLVAAAMRLENSEFATREGRGGERQALKNPNLPTPKRLPVNP